MAPHWLLRCAALGVLAFASPTFAQTPPLATTAPLPDPPPRPESGMYTGGMLLTVAGGVALGMGTFLLVMDGIIASVDDPDTNSSGKKALPRDIAIALAGSVGLGVGIPLIVLSRKGKAPPAALAPRVTVGPRAATLTWQF
jgi:hypothetical protein